MFKRIVVMDYIAARHNMVESQIRPNHVTNADVIDAMGAIPREKFVPNDVAGVAYADAALLIGEGRYLMAPMLVARLLQDAHISKNDLVLNIGCGSGYSVAVLARIAKAVVAVEVDRVLAERAGASMVELGVDNAMVVEAALATGYAKQSPYDAIFFDGAVEEIPQIIFDQLAEGGRLVAVIACVGSAGRSTGKAMVMTKISGKISKTNIFDVVTPYLPGFFKEKAFEF
jgi:protein-L-isoaspartate(D-aspartate) O-methyltransferase